MAGESELERRSSFPLVVGLVVFFAVALVGVVSYGIREAYYKSRELEKVGVIGHSWMWADPQIARELGTLTNASGYPDAVEEFQGRRTAHMRYHVTGSKNTGDVDIWMKQLAGTSWIVTGALLTTADKRTVAIGSPPAPNTVAGKKD